MNSAMTEFFLNYYFMPFHMSVVALILLSLAETIGIFLGYRPSHFLQRMTPDWLLNSPLLDVKFSKYLIVVFLLINFSFAGYLLELSFFAMQHYFVSPYYLLIPALVIDIFFTVFMIHCLDQVIKPKVSHSPTSLVGRLATVSTGVARPGFSAQARVRDEFGQLHYVQVEPEYGELELQAQVLLTKKTAESYYIAKKVLVSNHLFTLGD